MKKWKKNKKKGFENGIRNTHRRQQAKKTNRRLNPGDSTGMQNKRIRGTRSRSRSPACQRDRCTKLYEIELISLFISITYIFSQFPRWKVFAWPLGVWPHQFSQNDSLVWTSDQKFLLLLSFCILLFHLLKIKGFFFFFFPFSLHCKRSPVERVVRLQ